MTTRSGHSAAPLVSPREARERIGVLASHGIGDVVCATGLIEGIRAAHPDAYLCCVVKSRTEGELLAAPGLVDNFIYFNTAARPTLSETARFLRRIRREHLDTFVAVTDLARDKAPVLALLSGARRRVGESWSPAGRLYTHRVARNDREHKVDSNARIGAAIGVHARLETHLALTAAELDAATAMLRREGFRESEPLVLLHVGSGAQASHKRWPLESYEQLIRRLWTREAAPGVALLGGPDEREDCDLLRGRLDGRLVSFAGRLGIRETAALCAHANLVVGADSGILHLAAAVGTPVITMFGPTDAARTAPVGAHVVQLGLPCAPCYSHLPNGCGLPQCMSGITVERVLAACVSEMSRQPIEADMNLRRM